VGVGAGCGGTTCVATEKNAKIAKVHSIASRFGHEDLIITKLFVKVCEKSKGKLSIAIKNFKISQLQEKLELLKFG
jgi:hypothetical protein